MSDDSFHDEIGGHALYVVKHVLPDIAENYSVCLPCLAAEVVRQLEALLKKFEPHPADAIGPTKGSA
jgi:hypothetical protein